MEEAHPGVLFWGTALLLVAPLGFWVTYTSSVHLAPVQLFISPPSYFAVDAHLTSAVRCGEPQYRGYMSDDYTELG